MIDSLATISGVCIALVAAVLGLAFPMFVQSINDFPDKYGYRAFSERFENENLYKFLKPTLVVCVIELVVFPFVILGCNAHILNIVLATTVAISVFVLCFAVIGTCRLLVVYGNPSRYLNWVKKKVSSEDIFQILQILIVQGSKNKAKDNLYNDATREFCERLMVFQRKCVTEWYKSEESDKSKVDDFFKYPSPIFQALSQIGLCSADPENVILNKRTEIVDILYNIADDFPITDQVYYYLLWPWIYGMVEGKYDEWMKQYWRIAAQYYNLKLDQSDEEKEKEKFREFHLMVGVLLFYQKRYDVLRYAFTSTTIYQYPLIPCTFPGIFSYCEKFPIDEDPVYLTNHYNMFKIFQGANIEYMIYGLLLDYLALLMVRLFSVNDYNITFSNPTSLPNAESTVEGNEYKINIITAIIGHLEDIPDDTLEALDFKPEWRQKAVTLLEKFIGKCEKEKENLKTRRVVDEEKREIIKQSLIEISNKNSPFLPASEGKDKGEKDRDEDKGEDKKNGDEKFLSEVEVKLPNELILANSRLVLRPDLVESMIQGLHIKLREFYCGRLLQMGAIKTYLIAYGDFGETMKRLKLTSEFAIVAIGVPSNVMAGIAEFNMDTDKITYKSNGEDGLVNVYIIPSYPEDTVLIMKDKDVPRFKYRNLEDDEYEKDELSEIETKTEMETETETESESGAESETGSEVETGTEKHLYSNIDNIEADNPVLKVKQGFYVHIPKKLEYVCIRMSYRLEPDATVVSKVESIKKIYYESERG